MRIVVVFILLVVFLSTLIVFAEPFTNNWEFKNIDLYAYKYFFPDFNGYDYCSVVSNTSVLFVYFTFDYSFETLYVNANIINMSSNLAFQYFKTVSFDSGIELAENSFVYSSYYCNVYDGKLVFLINVMIHDEYWVFQNYYIGVYEIDLRTFNVSRSLVLEIGEPYSAEAVFTDDFIVILVYRYNAGVGADHLIILDRRDFTIKAQYSVDYDLLYNMFQREGYTLSIGYVSINSVIELNNTLYVFTGIHLQYEYYEFPASYYYNYVAVMVSKLENGTVQTLSTILYMLEVPYPSSYDVLAVFNNRYNRWLIVISLETYDQFYLMNHGFGGYAGAGGGGEPYYYLIFIDADLYWYNYTGKLIIADSTEYLSFYDQLIFYCDSVFLGFNIGYFIYNSYSQYVYLSIIDREEIPYLYPYDVLSSYMWVVNDRVYGVVNLYDSSYYYVGTIFFADSLNGFKVMPSDGISYIQPSVLNGINYSIVDYVLKNVSLVKNTSTNTVRNVEVFQVNEGFTVELYDYEVADSPCCKVVSAGGGETTTKPAPLYFNVDVISNLKRFQLFLLLLYLLFFIPILKAYGVSRALAISSAICSSLSLLVGAYESFSFFVITMIIGFALWQSGY